MGLERLQPEGLVRSSLYSPAVKAGNTVYVAGQVSRDERGKIVARGDFRGQAHQVFANLQKALAAAGGTLKDLAKITVYVTDPRYRDPLREVQDQYLAGALPASTLLVVAALADPDYLIEIDAVAVLGA
jgi:enamine deaminase RidA (YjgF/YER057c/UK114 family)